MEVFSLLVIVSILSTSPAEQGPVLNLTVILTNISEFCPGGTIGLENTDLKVQYRSNHTGEEWVTLDNTIPPEEGSSWLLLPEELTTTECVEVGLLQEEHGGGKCNCWSATSSIMDDNVTQFNPRPR